MTFTPVKGRFAAWTAMSFRIFVTIRIRMMRPGFWQPQVFLAVRARVRKGSVSMLQEIRELLLDLFYPCQCPGCSRPVPGRVLLCPECRARLLQPRGFVPQGPLQLAVYRVFLYEGGIKSALHGAKFTGREDYLPRLAREMSAALQGRTGMPWQEEGILPPAVIPVPTDPGRRKKRGYDIPEEIFRPWAEKNQLPFLPVLRRIRPTQPQYGLTRTERRENLKGCFALKQGAALPQRAILADDICTSGSTLLEAARVLKRGGVSRVYGLVLAAVE